MVVAALDVYSDPNLVPSLLDAPSEVRFSVITLSAGWPEDLERLVAGLAEYCGLTGYELLAVSNASPEMDAAIEKLKSVDSRIRGLSFSQHVGFSGGRNAGILQSRGEIVVVADTSIEPAGDFLTPIGEALADPTVGLVGPYGLVSADLRHFHEAQDGEVDAMQAYCMGFRRADVRPPEEVGMFDPRYKFYRNADIEFSMHWRDKGYRILSLPLPLRRHPHREWEELTPDQRDKRSRDNFARFLRRWRERTDLLTGRAESHQPQGAPHRHEPADR